ncbi:MAG: GNAT family N-acetyltransferase [Anaerolineae bacterium]|nr:GNAT family N-acetyltransferase [Anaerolineae bacterium]
MKTRHCLLDDSLAWLRLRNALWPDDPADNESGIAAYFAGNALACDQVIVAETDDGVVVGFIELSIRNYAEGSDNPRVPYVEGWLVDEPLRGQGVGRLLMRSAEAWAREQGFSELASDTEIDNENSIAAHNTLGFDEVGRTVNFLKSL